ncbi:calmodulin, putative [Perkinsus marinus ATCC 50983]|uniref:Calmodulin n=1 Tax=Perkinsus marinus (strain ATCC 50983 / TXsc) TaxID=423536 RepID=C5LYE4_PERM5|nr:calmodulin, putative [Perkinsus marinus ATCC 50983]EEQ98182.1 calmodulin, putative [Perkinsus marinus ATCC 50983]|eukprot:XP_002765465.1 calmodulin, putative [Perkinsus marinus ATCC 50983]
MAEIDSSEIEECFRIFAGPSNEQLPTNNIGPALRSLGIHISEEALADLTVEIGIEHGLDLHEFTRLYERLKDADGPGDEKSLREAFRVLDVTGSGKVSVKDIRHIVTTLGEKLSDADMDTFLESAGIPVDIDTSLDYEQFHRMFECLLLTVPST